MSNNRKNDEKLFTGILRLDSKVMGLVFGLLLGIFIFAATNIVVLRGGHMSGKGEQVVGPHLALLGEFFIGYKVSFFGSLIGFVYGFAVGTLAGSLVGWIYI